jgi:hypothetical protein
MANIELLVAKILRVGSHLEMLSILGYRKPSRTANLDLKDRKRMAASILRPYFPDTRPDDIHIALHSDRKNPTHNPARQRFKEVVPKSRTGG